MISKQEPQEQTNDRQEPRPATPSQWRQVQKDTSVPVRPHGEAKANRDGQNQLHFAEAYREHEHNAATEITTVVLEWAQHLAQERWRA